MDPISTTSIAAIAVVAAAVILGCAILGLPVVLFYLWHRQNMAKIKGTHAQQVDALNERIERIEKKCAEMQEKITDAHMLLADEQRQLDRKLSESFPGIIASAPSIPEEPSKSASRRENRARKRE